MPGISVEIPWNRIQDLLCCAFEGGSNSWYKITEFGEPANFEIRTDPGRIFRHMDYPVNDGGYLIIVCMNEDKPQTLYRLDRCTLEKGLHRFAKKYPKHFGDFVQENDDAITGDVFLQTCLFGEIVYG